MAKSFVNGRKNDQIRLVAFAGEAHALYPLTTDYALLQQYIRELSPNMIRTTGTAIGDALARSINRLRNSPAKSKVLILLSDGDNTAGNLDPLTVARLAQNFNVKIYTIAVGKRTRSTDTLGGTTQFDKGILKTIATVGQGGFFRASDAVQLRHVSYRPPQTRSGAGANPQRHSGSIPPLHLLGITFLFLKNTVLGNSWEY